MLLRKIWPTAYKRYHTFLLSLGVRKIHKPSEAAQSQKPLHYVVITDSKKIRVSFINFSYDKKQPLHRESEKVRYSGTPLNGYPSTADTHNMTKVVTVLPFASILKQPLNSRHPATPYNGQFSRSQLYASNTQWPRFSGHSSTFSASLSTTAAVVNNLTLD